MERVCDGRCVWCVSMCLTASVQVCCCCCWFCFEDTASAAEVCCARLLPCFRGGFLNFWGGERGRVGQFVKGLFGELNWECLFVFSSAFD